MTKADRMRLHHTAIALSDYGVTYAAFETLRRASMTLQRWFEKECGDGNQYGSWAIERDETTDKPYMVHHHYARGAGKDRITRTSIADREKGARKRIAGTLAHWPKLTYYIQTDPRGCALYVLRPGDVPEGADPSAYYSRGIAVY